MSYVVRVNRARRGSPKTTEEYLCAIRYDLYGTGNTITHLTTQEREDAFVFETLQAAETCACFVGGRVEETDEQPNYSSVDDLQHNTE